MRTVIAPPEKRQADRGVSHFSLNLLRRDVVAAGVAAARPRHAQHPAGASLPKLQLVAEGGQPDLRRAARSATSSRYDARTTLRSLSCPTRSTSRCMRLACHGRHPALFLFE